MPFGKRSDPLQQHTPVSEESEAEHALEVARLSAYARDIQQRAPEEEMDAPGPTLMRRPTRGRTIGSLSVLVFLLLFSFVPPGFSAQSLLKNARMAASAVNAVDNVSIVDMTTSHTGTQCGRYQLRNGVRRRFFNGYDGMWIERSDGHWFNVDGLEISQDRHFSWCDHMGSGRGAIFEDVAAATVVALEGRAIGSS